MLEKIDADIKAAMLDRDMVKTSVLKMLKSAMQNQAIENKGKLTDDDAMIVLRREVKKRKEAASAYEQAGDELRASTELAEAEIIETYLPEQMSEEEVRTEVKQIIESANTDNTGQVIGMAMGKLKGKADGSLVAKVVKEEMAQ